jgi:hypothetical protein
MAGIDGGPRATKRLIRTRETGWADTHNGHISLPKSGARTDRFRLLSRSLRAAPQGEERAATSKTRRRRSDTSGTDSSHRTLCNKDACPKCRFTVHRAHARARPTGAVAAHARAVARFLCFNASIRSTSSTRALRCPSSWESHLSLPPHARCFQHTSCREARRLFAAERA